MTSPQALFAKAGLTLSPEQWGRLEVYHALLVKWQRAINLVGPATLADAWARHFLDSAQLLSHLPETARVVMDLGSGAGFPGMVLAALRPDLEVHLVESDRRKCDFLTTVSRETKSPVHIHCQRIESLAMGDALADVVTARALAPLERLLDWSLPLVRPDGMFLFLKGSQAESELVEARQRYAFEASMVPSVTEPRASVVALHAARARDA